MSPPKEDFPTEIGPVNPDRLRVPPTAPAPPQPLDPDEFPTEIGTPSPGRLIPPPSAPPKT